MIAEGDVVFVDYGEVPQVVHTRLVGAHVRDDIYVIITPDHDVSPQPHYLEIQELPKPEDQQLEQLAPVELQLPVQEEVPSSCEAPLHILGLDAVAVDTRLQSKL